ncbi:helix-turn-helix domain-containing protein [Chryseobacterium sp.]|uniref:XRE family transcriptional regulator n=1 Tax=Chryseobacterium sp. TaxID=1871047 RepID=UPI00289A02CD|nr:helix-turn-helix domain-containing protein [Chryseobacterium sp.]
MLNIRRIRENKNLTQDEMVALTGIPKRSYVDYENEKADIRLGNLRKIASVLNVSVQELISETKSEEKTNKLDVSNNVSLNVSEPNVKNSSVDEDSFMHEPVSDYKKRSPAVVTIDSHNNDNIALVPIPLSAGYLKGYSSTKFISKLPSYRMPGLNNGIFRMFEVEGNSMFPTIPNKSYVVGQFVENWIDDIKDNQIYAVISSELEDGLVKRCINKIRKYNNLICKSDNRKNFPAQNINPASIKEIWEIKLHLNFQLPDPADIYDRMSDLEGEVYSLKQLITKN